MSLFGNTNQNKPSLFGNVNTAPQTAGASTGGLFGGLGAATSQAQSTGGMFGGMGATSQPQTSGGLFGTATTKPQQQSGSGSGGLFGGLGTTPATQSQQTSGLFGATAQPQTGSGTTGGLFGGSLAQPQQPQQNTGGLFGNTTTQTNPSASMFAPTPQPQPLSQSRQQNGTSGAYFDAILEKSRKRAHDEDSLGLQLGLGDIRQRMKRLAPTTQDSSVDGRAHYLLAASGVDPGAALRDLNLFTAATGRLDKAPPPEPPVDADVEAYLTRLETQTTMSMISEGLARSIRDFDDFLEENVAMEWSAQRKRIYEHFGIKPRREQGAGPSAASFAATTKEPTGGFGRSRRGKGLAPGASKGPGIPRASVFGKSSMQRSVIGAVAPGGTGNRALFTDMEKIDTNASPQGPSDRFLREKQARYIEKVQNLNGARLKNLHYPIANEFSAVVGQGGEQHSADVYRAYRCLMEIVGEDPDSDRLQLPGAVKQRQFASAYLDDNTNSAQAADLRKRILSGSLRYLQKEFFENVEAMVAKNPKEALVGGRPSPLTKIKGYVRLRSARKDLVTDNSALQIFENDYVWAVIFYLLRSGHVEEANAYVQANRDAFRVIDRNFMFYIADYANSPDRKLRHDLQDRIHNEYNQRNRIAPDNSIDPFRMACYKVIGRCELNIRALDQNIVQNQDDFVWIQFVLAREANRVDEIAGDAYGLVNVQKTFKDIGARMFSKGNENSGPFSVYFVLLVLSGLFEDAVDLLYRHSISDCIHFATSLAFYGLLRVSDPDVAEGGFISYTIRQQPQIAFGLMIGFYTAEFRAANVSAAVDYLTLICLNSDLKGDAGSKQVALCHEALQELILESREFALLLGDIRQDGKRIQGVIEERLALINLSSADDFMRTVTIQAGSVADDNGRTTDAVLLYHLAEEYDNVVNILNRALSEAIAVPIGHSPMRLQPLKPRSADRSGKPAHTSLSLTSVDDPVELATIMTNLYSNNRMYLNKIKQENRAACEALLNISRAKEFVENREWASALDVVRNLDILPLNADGNPSEVRSYATKFSSLPQEVANTIPSLLMWTILCCNSQKTSLMNAQYGGNEGTRRLMIAQLKQQNMDLTTYTSQLRYRFPASLHEALARAQSE
ncbi:4ce156c7-7455-4d9e-8807-ef260a6d0af1 [Sclerotinia trifoliorum]|uniref:4ce156c7-7455-4d9e-8807-ef260a6d0af1 n=1 Tax=Sclerotinia trifoliorum TaxID=28548 RepID=A0A8H2VRH8_9HELO|nr:4ce156c7-7455-4d9e-8807-ef260a6d0af1 [Sclerotinia trifoliorum]